MSHLVQCITIALLFLLPLSLHAQDPSWATVNAEGNATERHENGFVAYNGKLYLLGGRGVKPVQIFDPLTSRWSEGASPPFQMHHFQAVVFNDLIYVIGAYTGACCSDEFGVDHVWTYNPQTNNWNQSHEIPANRRRGSSGAIVYNNKIYIIGGIEGGHGSPATGFNWFDEYDPATGQWKVMPDAPRKRDHFHAVLHNNKIYLTGGRDTSNPNFTSANISEVDVYDFGTGSWSTLSNTLPTPRGGTASILYRGEILVIGGESSAQTLAFNTTEALDLNTQSWNSRSNLNVGRHGTQATILNDAVYIAAGAAETGGSPELNSIERYENDSQQTFSFTQTLKNNWNLLSLPLETDNNFYTSIYSTVDLDGITPYTWNGFDYVPSNQLTTGNSFWLKLKNNPSSIVQTITGDLINELQYSLNQGWNLIASPSCNGIPIQNNSTIPTGAVAEGLTYFYDIGGYKPAFNFSFPRGQLSQGKGYWVYAVTNATLTLNCGNTKQLADKDASQLEDVSKTFGYVTLRDQNSGIQNLYFGNTLEQPERIFSYKLPPRGPGGEFDVRFTDDTRLKESNEATIRIYDATFPLSLAFTQTPPNQPEGILFIDEVTPNGTVLHTHSLSYQERVEIYDESISYLRLRFQEADVESIPGQFTLHGNYPNPFNPTTRITFDIPMEGDVTLRVMDLLGREVSHEVFEGMSPAHNYSISYDANDLPAGIYLYTLTLQTTDQHVTQTGRMILLK